MFIKIIKNLIKKNFNFLKKLLYTEKVSNVHKFQHIYFSNIFVFQHKR